MADDVEEDVLELEIPEEELDVEQEEPESDEPSEGDDDETVISFSDETEAAPASGERDTELVRHLRTQIRERDKAIAEFRRQAPDQQQITVGNKPTLESCDYDEEAFESQLDAWKARKAEAEQVEVRATEERRKIDESWDADRQRYAVDKAALKIPNYQEAEESVLATLNQVQQAVIVRVAGNAATLIAALGNSPSKLAELSKIEDPLKMAAAVAKLEGNLKVTTKRKAPEPETIVRGKAPVGSDKALERLEKEADRTGDRTKLIAYRSKLKSQAKN